MRSADRSTDVIVVGGGMAGLVGAVRALESGAGVVLLEKGTRFGGSMYLSGGIIWTYDSYQEMREAVPDGDAVLQQLLIDSVDEGYEWLESIGAELTESDSHLPGSGREIEPAQFTDRMVSRIEEAGGEAMLQTPMDRIRTDEGSVCSVAARDPDGDELVIDAESVLLATGGFQGNAELVERYITSHTENLWLRANPWSTGDGFEAARDIGGKATKALSTFYGHNLAAPPAEFSALEFREASQYYGPLTVALNRSGERFTDESESVLEETLAQDTATQAGGRAYYVFDRDIYEADALVGTTSSDVEEARRLGGHVAETESLAALGNRLAEWGVNGTTAVETIEEYNRAIRAGETARLSPPRRSFRRVIDTPPFYAVEVQPGITFTMGGLDVDVRMRVKRRSASHATVDHRYRPADQREIYSTPIPGLFAAGVDIGNINHRTYLGGLCQCLVTGRIAGANAAEFATK